MQKLNALRQGVASALLGIVVLAGAVALLGACNTVAGVGQDMRAAGDAITGSADKTKNPQ